MKKIAILGSTGSIGTQTLEVVENNGDIQVEALSANGNVDLLEKQARKFKPSVIAVFREDAAKELKERLKDMNIRIVTGMDGLIEIATLPETDILVTAIVGMIGILPTIEAIKAGKDIALANKETLVTAGHIIMPLAERMGVQILPVDSEHSAIFQCLQGAQGNTPTRLILTASGGPFRTWKKEDIYNARPEQALKHPNWSMGRKITIDSASMMNKALEVIEARWLFDMPAEKIDVLIHPQSVIHSMVEYADGAVMAQLGTPDMRLPILYAMSWPERLPTGGKRLDFTQMNALTFEQPDYNRFPGLKLAYDALAVGGSMSAVLNGANEVAVDAFLHEKIPFGAIARLVEETMQAVPVITHPTLEQVFECDRAARQKAAALMSRFEA